jgi:hypothetical protein
LDAGVPPAAGVCAAVHYRDVHALHEFKTLVTRSLASHVEGARA